MQISKLKLRPQVSNALRRKPLEIDTIEALLEFIKIHGIDYLVVLCRNFGRKSLEELKKALQENNISYEFQSAQHSVQSDAAIPFPTYAVCPHCHQPIMLVAPETPRG